MKYFDGSLTIDEMLEKRIRVDEKDLMMYDFVLFDVLYVYLTKLQPSNENMSFELENHFLIKIHSLIDDSSYAGSYKDIRNFFDKLYRIIDEAYKEIYKDGEVRDGTTTIFLNSNSYEVDLYEDC